MALKIYKPGQGYWTRMLSAIGAAVLIIGAAEWTSSVLRFYLKFDAAIFVQAGVAIAIIAVFGLLVFRFVGAKPNTCDFLIATEGEMKKVNWPSREEVIGATWVVIACVVLLTLLLLLADTVFFLIFSKTGVIQTAG